MAKVCLSKGNSDRLRELGLYEAATVILLPSLSFTAREDTQHDTVEAANIDVDEAAAKLTRAFDEQSRHDIVLQIFAYLVLQLRKYKCNSREANTENRDSERNIPTLGQNACQSSSNERLDMSQRDGLAQTLTSLVFWKPEHPESYRTALIVETVMASLLLLACCTSQEFKLSTPMLVAVTACTDTHDSWTTETGAALAQRIISSQVPEQRLMDFITGPVLNQQVREILSSPTGAVYLESPHPGSSSSSSSSDSTTGLADYEHVAAVLKWAIEMAKGPDLANYWHLFVPALVSLAESHETAIRARGLEAIILFLERCPPHTIHTTGIGQLFENTVLPTLLLLPTLTPERDSVNLLSLGYTAALQLATISPDHHGANTRRLLDAVVRDGLLAGYRHASDYILIVDILMQNIVKAVTCLGIFCTKHLADLLEIIESVMCDSFALDRPAVLISASDALVAIIANCWPAISQQERVEQILRILCICWLNICNTSTKGSQPAPSPNIEDVKHHVRGVAALVRLTAETEDGDVKGKLRVAIARDYLLQDLFVEL